MGLRSQRLQVETVYIGKSSDSAGFGPYQVSSCCPVRLRVAALPMELHSEHNFSELPLPVPFSSNYALGFLSEFALSLFNNTLQPLLPVQCDASESRLTLKSCAPLG
jgi:hypothetical protein